MTDIFALRGDLRWVYIPVGGAVDDEQHNLEATVGVVWTLGGGAAPDADGDGVPDRKDKCPDTPKGATVDATGCPTDADGDGVYDGLDKCPDTPKGWPVDGTGCPKDSDGDGVVDGQDTCPGTPKGATVDAKGCPSDSDGDGVYEGLDRCPGTPKGAQVDAAGCPKDADGDGVADGLDRCPGTQRGWAVDASGCPKDSDGDGVPDGADNCPGTPAGAKVDEKGCPKAEPLFMPGKKSLVLEGVNFETNSADLTADSHAILDKVATSLVEWPDVRVEVGGHTDSSGSSAYNAKLSQSRAESVMNYLAGKGVAASRMTAKGYGEDSPIADNATREGRAKNRRVELTKAD
jgi:outer membrane protein OmpA-like peptidoglycan-associated protein